MYDHWRPSAAAPESAPGASASAKPAPGASASAESAASSASSHGIDRFLSVCNIVDYSLLKDSLIIL